MTVSDDTDPSAAPDDLGPIDHLQRAPRLAWRATGIGVVEFVNSSSPTFAASIAYYSLLSFFPFLWLVASLLGKLAVRGETLLPVIGGALPTDLGFLTDQIEGIARVPLELSVAGTGLTFLAAMGVFGAITSAVNHAWGVENDLGFFKHKLVAFVTTIAAGAILIGSLGLLSLVELVEATWFSGIVDAYPSLARLSGLLYRWAPTALFVLAVGLIYYYVPNAKVRLRDVWFGALLVGLLWRLALAGFTSFMSDPERLLQIHGQIGAVVVFLLWVYYSATILLYGAHVTAAYARLRKHLPSAAPAAPARDA